MLVAVEAEESSEVAEVVAAEPDSLRRPEGG
jgi:hypothetical protein